ncbi:MAG: hypothetical protein AB1512_28045 [Thermodesulfobacteriota bacterium]
MNGSKTEFEDHREEVWAQLSKELGGKFVNVEGWARDRVQAQYENWHVTLDFDLHAGYRSESIHTRFRAPVPRSAFQLRVFHQELIYTVAHVFGMQDIRVGDEAFDRMFVVQTTDEAKAGRLFQDPGLRRMMLKEPDLEITLEIPSGMSSFEDGEGCDELSIQVPGMVEDASRLRSLFNVFAHLLHELHKLGLGACT